MRKAAVDKHHAGRGLPAAAWLHRYRIAWLGPEVVAALFLWALIVPESMAYAGTAGATPTID